MRRYTRKCFGINPKGFFNKYVDKYINKICEISYPIELKFFPNINNIPEEFYRIFQV